MIWHSTDVADVLKELSVDADAGLSNGVADQRLEIYGKNIISNIDKPTFFKRFLSELNKKIVYVLVAIALLCFVVSMIYNQQDIYSPLLIIAIVVINALVSAYHLYRCDNAMDSLRTAAHPNATVIRDGIEKQIPSEELVPGDIVVLKEGDYITADARIIEDNNFRCNESIISGITIPVEKRADIILEDISPADARTNMVFSGCSVIHGNAKAVVVETGLATEIGKNSAIIQQTGSEELPINSSLSSIERITNVVVLVICIIAFLLGMIQNFHSSEPFASLTMRMLLNSVALGVATIPESLPAISTIVIALGIQRIVRDNIIIKKISALEFLGKTGVICADKTGILTKNHMNLSYIFDGENMTRVEDEELTERSATVLRLATACSMLESDYTESAIQDACIKYTSMSVADIENIFPRLASIPFDSQRKTMTSINMINGQPIAIVKGAPEIVLENCSGADVELLKKANEALTGEALRVICIAMKPLEEIPANPSPEEIENDLTFVGLLGLSDPPRAEVIEGIKICDDAGIKTIMITGDNIITAKAIARRIGILKDDSQAITGQQLSEMSDDELAERITEFSVYARITPADKLRIISAWQSSGRIVTITGNDIEDADALSAADIGCAIGKFGTDVAKGNADIIITDSHFSSIVAAIKESRGFFENIKKSVIYLFSCNFGEILAYLSGMLIFGMPPLAAVQLFWINLLTDCAPTIALTMEKSEDNVMAEKAFIHGGRIFNLKTVISSSVQSVTMAIAAIIAFAIGQRTGGDTLAMTMAFTTLSLTQIFHSYNIKTSRSIIFTNFKSNEFMNMTTILVLFVTVFLILTPAGHLFGLTTLSAAQFFTTLALSLIIVPVSEILKAIKIKGN